MLINFSVENYLSFKDKVTFSLSASSIKEHENHVFNVAEGRYNLLNGALLYGSNGSGKSNLITAMSFMKDFVINSFKDKQAKEKIGVEHFKLSTETTNKPSFFEIEILIENFKYRYGFSLTQELIVEEWLLVAHKVKEYPLFKRKLDEDFGEYIYHLDPRFQESDQVNTETVRKNSLLLSAGAQYNGEISKKLIHWFQEATFVSGTNYTEYIDYTAELLSGTNPNETVLSLIKKANLGFSDIKVRKKDFDEDMLLGFPKEFRSMILKSKQKIIDIKTVHSKRNHLGRKVDDIEFDLMENESLGSQKFFAIIGPIYNALLNGSLLIIDELDARLHTNLTKLIIDFYQLPENNTKMSQFLFATHNTQFMDRKVFRRDQLYLVDKTAFESSVLYNIYGISKMFEDKPSVRKDASYEKEYLDGNYGAVPFDQDKGKQLNIWDLLNE